MENAKGIKPSISIEQTWMQNRSVKVMDVVCSMNMFENAGILCVVMLLFCVQCPPRRTFVKFETLEVKVIGEGDLKLT